MKYENNWISEKNKKKLFFIKIAHHKFQNTEFFSFETRKSYFLHIGVFNVYREFFFCNHDL